MCGHASFPVSGRNYCIPGAGAKIITHSVGGSVGGLGSSGSGVGSSSGSGNVGMGPPSTCGRGVGRPATATTTPQASAPLFVSNPGSITVVTRTVAAGQGMIAM